MKVTIRELRAIVREELLSEIIRKVGNQWCLFSKEGKKLGCHKTRYDAHQQEIAIQYSKGEK